MRENIIMNERIDEYFFFSSMCSSCLSNAVKIFNRIDFFFLCTIRLLLRSYFAWLCNHKDKKHLIEVKLIRFISNKFINIRYLSIKFFMKIWKFMKFEKMSSTFNSWLCIIRSLTYRTNAKYIIDMIETANNVIVCGL